jgi:hypothetical protein
MVGYLKMNTALEYSTRVVQEGDRRCKKSTLNDLAYLTPLRIPLMNPVLFCQQGQSRLVYRSPQYFIDLDPPMIPTPPLKRQKREKVLNQPIFSEKKNTRYTLLVFSTDFFLSFFKLMASNGDADQNCNVNNQITSGF